MVKSAYMSYTLTVRIIPLWRTLGFSVHAKIVNIINTYGITAKVVNKIRWKFLRIKNCRWVTMGRLPLPGLANFPTPSAFLLAEAWTLPPSPQPQVLRRVIFGDVSDQ